MGTPPPAVAWAPILDLEHLQGRMGRLAIQDLLAQNRAYLEPPALSGIDGISAKFAPTAAERVAFARFARGTVDEYSVTVRISMGRVWGQCSCYGQSICAHGLTLIVDLASLPAMRDALFRGEPTAPFLAMLGRRRTEQAADQMVSQRLADWAVRPRVLDVCVDLESHHRGVFADLRFRDHGQRSLLDPRELRRARLLRSDRSLLDIGFADRSYGTQPAKKALRLTGPAISMALEILSRHEHVSTLAFKRPLEFSPAPVVAHMSATAIEDGGLGELSLRWRVEGEERDRAMDDLRLLRGPFPFAWDAARFRVHRVADGVDIDLLEEFTERGPLPLTAQTRPVVGRALRRHVRGRGVALPPPEVFGLAPVEAPRFVLRLEGTALDVRGALVAAYAAGEFTLLPAPLVAAPASEVRDVDAEDAAAKRVLGAGLSTDDAGVLGVCGEDAIAFWRSALPDLRDDAASAIEVLLAESLARVKIGGALRHRLHVGLEGDWLRTDLTFDEGELTVEIARVRAALRAKRRWVELADGTLHRISNEIAELVAESAHLLDDDGTARLPPHQLGRLERWAEEFGGEVDERVVDLGARLRALAVAPKPDLPRGLRCKLRPYQRAGVAWLQFLRELGAGGILADDMGLGKTVMTLVLLLREKQRLGRQPSLVVCPTSVVGNWVREAERFTPGLAVVVLHGAGRAARAADAAEADLVVTTYALLRRDVELLEAIEFRFAIFDEAQNVKNADAVTTRAARRLRSSARLALSGTPVENRLRELWSIMDLVNPGMLGSRSEFEDRYERPIVEQPDGVQAARLRAVLRPFVLRRTKADVLDDLPPKTEIDRTCVLEPAQKKLYDALAISLRKAVKKKIEVDGLSRSGLNVLTALLRLRQMACDPRLVDGALPATSSAKRGEFLELVEELVAERRRALVFSQFVELLGLWRAELDERNIRYEYLDGSTVRRDEVVDRFQTGDAPLFLISLKAGGAGLNLTAADTVIHCDPWWNPAVEDQATDRAHRIGQSRAVTVVRLVAQGTIEDKIANLKSKKRSLADAVVGGDAGALRGLTQEDVDALLGAVG